jgi:hypothetical protein
MQRVFAMLITGTVLLTALAVPARAESICGDLSQEGTVDSIDAAIILQYVAGLHYPDALSKGNVNGQSGINAVDALLILQYTAGLFDGLSCP